MTSVQKISWSKEEIKLVADYLVKIANQSEERKMEIPIESETLKHEKVVEEAKMGIAEALITNEINEEALVEDQKIKEIMEFSQIPQPKTVKRIEEKIPEEKIDVIEEKRLEFEEDKTGIEEMGEIGFEEMGEIGFEKRTIEGEIESTRTDCRGKSTRTDCRGKSTRTDCRGKSTRTDCRGKSRNRYFITS
ncbi:MAG: hypothetical protein ACTSPP_09785 [Candidatus Heimdallarchaeaceae archaeon]